MVTIGVMVIVGIMIGVDDGYDDDNHDGSWASTVASEDMLKRVCGFVGETLE